ncbi:hypothetical protein [Parafrankia discariae]|nr:hypothetical protein [Parafrankia discariae]
MSTAWSASPRAAEAGFVNGTDILIDGGVHASFDSGSFSLSGK